MVINRLLLQVVTVMFLFVSCVHAAPVTNGLVVYYNGNLSGNSVVDISGNNNQGIATSATQGTDQATGANYINLNGESSKIAVSKNTQTNISNPLTIEFIGSVNAFSQYEPIVSKYNGGTAGWYLCCSSGTPFNRALFGAIMKSGGEDGYESGFDLVAGQVYDIIVTYDNSISHIYVNGVDSGSRTWNSPIVGSSNNITIGGYVSGLSDPSTNFNTSMYVFRLYNRALSSTEVSQNYNDWKNLSNNDNINAIKKLVYGDGGLPRYMGSYAMGLSGSGMNMIDSNMYSVGSISTPYYQDNGSTKTNYILSNSSISGVKWKTYYGPGSSALLSFSGNNRNRLETISLSSNSLDLVNSVTYNAKSLVTLEAVPVTGYAFQFYGDGLNTISGNTVQAYTDNGVIQNDYVIYNSQGDHVYNYYQQRPAGTTRSNSINLPLSSPQLTPMPCPSGYLGSLSFAIHADAQDSDSLKTLMYGTNKTQDPVYGKKGYIGHGLICTWSAFAASTYGNDGIDKASFKSTLDDMYTHGFEIVPHNVYDGEVGFPTRADAVSYLPWYSTNYSSKNWIDHGLDHGNRNIGLKSLGLVKNSQYYIGDLMRQYGYQYAWSYQDVNPQWSGTISSSLTKSLGLPYDIIWTNTNFTLDDGTPMYEWSSTMTPDSISLNYFTNETVQNLINNYGVCLWHDYTAENDDPFENYYYTEGNPYMINQTYDNLLLNMSQQKNAGKLWNPTVSHYIDYWRAACNVECKCTGLNTYILINHNSAAVTGYAMRVTGSYTVKLDGNALNTTKNGEDTIFWMNLPTGTHSLTLVGA